MLNISNFTHKTTQDKIKDAILKAVKRSVMFNYAAREIVLNSKGGEFLMIRYSKKSGFEFHDKSFNDITDLVLKSLKMYGSL